MTSVGRRRTISSTDFKRQQSPSFGNPPTGATSAHHFVTPTRNPFAPISQRIEVALGASETIRRGVEFCLEAIGTQLTRASLVTNGTLTRARRCGRLQGARSQSPGG